MKSTCQAGVTFIIRTSIALGAAFGLAACGGDSPEALSASLASAAEDIDWVADGEQECVAAAIVDTIGFETLAADNITTDRVDAEPALAKTLITESTDVRTAVESCVDANRLFRTALADDVGIDELTCDTEFSGEPIVAQTRKNIVAGTGDLEIDDTSDHRDLFRPCLSDADFRNTFGLDDPDELVSAMHGALPIGLREIETSNECLATRIVTKFGVETLEELGLTVEQPALDLTSFTDEAADSILDGAHACSDATPAWRSALFNSNEPFADCAVDLGGDEYTSQTVAIAFGTSGATRARDRIVEESLDECVDERSASMFAPLAALDRIDVDYAARVWSEDWERNSSLKFNPSEHMIRCSLRGTSATLGPDVVNAMFAEWSTLDPDSVEAWEILVPFYREFQTAQRTCGNDWYFITTEAHQAGASPETLDCMRSRFGDDEAIAQMADTFASYISELDDYRWEGVLSQIDTAFDRCRSDDELRIYNEWSEYMIGGLGLGGVNTGVDSA